MFALSLSRIFCLCAGVLCALSVARPACGQDAALAESLFQEGQALMRTGNYAQACEKLAASYAIEASTGTLINLATCHEKNGKLATAWAAFSKALPQAKAEGRKDRQQYCQARIDELQPKLSYLRIEVTEGQPPGLRILLNGTELARASWGLNLPVDTGQHTVVAEAPGHERSELSVELGGPAETKSLAVPLLRAISASPAEPLTEPSSTPTPSPPDSAGKPTLVYVAAGAAVALGVGTIASGALYLGRRSDFNKSNLDPTASVQKRRDLRDSANTMGTVSTVLGVGALAATGLTLVLLRTPGETIALSGIATGSYTAIELSGRF
jgi:hypothetical protein